MAREDAASGRTKTATWVESQKRWRIRVTRDGVTKAFYCSTPGRKGQSEANRQADIWLMEGCPQKVRSSLTVETAIELYKDYLGEIAAKKLGKPKEKLKGVDYGNMRGPLSYLESRSDGIRSKKLGKVSEGDLQKIIDLAAAEGKAKKTLQNIRSAYLDFFRWCKVHGYLDTIPDGISVPHSARSKQKKILQPADLKILFSSDKTCLYGVERHEPLVYAFRLAVLTGLRPGELMALRWQDWDGDTLHVRGSINALGQETQGKNDNAIRDIRLIQLAKEQLTLHHISCGRPKVGYMFDLDTQKQYRNRWGLYCKHNGITYVTPYELRHTFVSICQRLPEGMVKQLVGHSKSMDTFGIYGHMVDGYGALMAKQLSGVFSDLIG